MTQHLPRCRNVKQVSGLGRSAHGVLHQCCSRTTCCAVTAKVAHVSLCHGGYTFMCAKRSLIWIKIFSTESSPKRYWRGPRSREAGEEVLAGTEIPGGGGRGSGGDRDPGRRRKRETTYRYTVTTTMTPALRRAAMRAILIFH